MIQTVRRVSLGFVTLGIVMACGQNAGRTVELGTSAQPLIAAAESLTGRDLGAKQLVLTFDDGPGPMAVTGALSTYLKDQGIKGTFFLNGACIAEIDVGLTGNDSCFEPVEGADAVVQKLTADGHLVANHSTTHRDMTGLTAAQRLLDVAETDALIGPNVPWNRFFFRAPYGNWDADAFNELRNTAMGKYVGPIYWTAGGGPTNADMAADWECWEVRNLTTKDCGDRYLKEIRAFGNGFLLFHDAKTGPRGNTVDLIKYLVPILKGEGFTFKTLEDSPAVAALLPKCHASCTSGCTGPATNQCNPAVPTTCPAAQYAKNGACTPCTRCAEGTYPSAACTADADTVCGACASCQACSGPRASDCGSCAADHFLAGDVCTTCTTCPAGSRVAAGCSKTADTSCVPGADLDPSGQEPNTTEVPPAQNTPPAASANEGGCAASPRRTSADGLAYAGLAFLLLRARKRRA